jgi:putative ABC transport system ATP-binding protein
MPRSNAGLGLDLRDFRLGFPNGAGGERTVLDIARFAVPARAQVAIVGAPESGKSALLHALAAIERPQRGSVFWGAIDVAALTRDAADRWRRGTLGFVFQQPHLFGGLSALDTVLLPLRSGRFRVDRVLAARARDLIARVGVRAEARVATLSRSDVQRAAVARALINAPAIVLADDPGTTLDRESAAAILALLSTLCREGGATLIVTTHDTQLAASLDERYDLVDRTLRRYPHLRLVARAA